MNNTELRKLAGLEYVNESVDPVINESIDKKVLNSYLQSVLSSVVDPKNPKDSLDSKYKTSDFSKKAISLASKDITAFQKKAGALLDGVKLDTIIKYFWYTRIHTGVNFMKVVSDKAVAKKLNAIATTFPELFPKANNGVIDFAIRESVEIDALVKYTEDDLLSESMDAKLKKIVGKDFADVAINEDIIALVNLKAKIYVLRKKYNLI